MVKPVQTLALSCMLALTLPGVSAVCDTEYNALIGAQHVYQGCINATCGSRPRNCVDIQALGYTTSGVYSVYYLAGSVETPVSVYCDMETAGGGWLVFQRRQDGTEVFYRSWLDYANGFGSETGEFWLGNTHLHMLTSSGTYKLRIDLEDFDGQTRYAEYASFSVGDPSSKYRLSVSGYNDDSDAGDAFGHHNGMKFSTQDMDNDAYWRDCADLYKGGWWYRACHYSNLNGLYLGGPHTSFADGIVWYQWKGNHYSLKFTEMKFKP